MPSHTYGQLLEDAGSNPARLRALADQLRSDPSADAQQTRLRAIHRALRLASRPDWRAEFGLPACDGRPLWRYRLSDEDFDRLQARLSLQRLRLLSGMPGPLAAMFVLWGAEWFRRHYDGSTRSWASLTSPLRLVAEYGVLTRITDDGLKAWGIEPLIINCKHLRLAAIARQGGFPVAAVDGGGNGWAPRYLERLVGLLLGEARRTLDIAEKAAESLADLIPRTWRSEEMHVVSAELALAIVALREEAEAAGATGSLVSAWLDQCRPGWRNDLPIAVNSRAGHALLDSMVRTPAVRGGFAQIGATRKLTITAKGRTESAELQLHGTLGDKWCGRHGATFADEWSRLRVYAAGAFARYAPGELAVADPGDGGTWVARPPVSRTILALPLSVAITLELRGGGERIGEQFIPPGGDAVRSDVQVWSEDDSDVGGEAPAFRLLGTGSGGYRPEIVFVDLPGDWSCRVEGAGSECARCDEDGHEGRRLWRVRGTAVAGSPRGDCYLIRSNQAEQTRDRLNLYGRNPRDFAHAETDVPVFLGQPSLMLASATGDRPPQTGEAWWRYRGSANWRADVHRAGPGWCEIAWRDRLTGHIRARCEAIVLPEAFGILREKRGYDLVVTSQGWFGAAALEGGHAIGQYAWRVSVRAGSLPSCCLVLDCEGGPPVRLDVSIPHQAWIFDWNGAALPNGNQLSLSTLRRYVARARKGSMLLAEALNRNGQRISEAFARWEVDGELPLSAIQDDLASMLRPHADIDAWLVLSFSDSDANRWRVGEFEMNLLAVDGMIRPAHAVTESGVIVAGRATCEPAEEHDFGPLSQEGACRQIEDLKGDWLIYLRSQRDVVSRPHYLAGERVDEGPRDALSAALACKDRKLRLAALAAILDGVATTLSSDASHKVVRLLIELAASLSGLPPATFDILSLMTGRPVLSAALVFFAADEAELRAVLTLSEGLPFAWCLIAKPAWDLAAEALFDWCNALVPGRIELAAAVISERRKAIAAEDPILEPLLGLSGSPLSRHEAVQCFLNQFGDKLDERWSPFRHTIECQLPDWDFDKRYWRALDAPIAAAQSARGERRLTPEEVLCVKDIVRRYPRWFRDGFAATMRGG